MSFTSNVCQLNSNYILTKFEWNFRFAIFIENSIKVHIRPREEPLRASIRFQTTERRVGVLRSPFFALMKSSTAKWFSAAINSSSQRTVGGGKKNGVPDQFKWLRTPQFRPICVRCSGSDCSYPVFWGGNHANQMTPPQHPHSSTRAGRHPELVLLFLRPHLELID